MGQAQQTFEQAESRQQQAREASTILLNRNLFSSYYLGTMFEKTVRAQQGETGMRMPTSVRRRLQGRWDNNTQSLGSISTYGRTREAWLDTLLITLGYEPLEQARAQDFKEETLPDGMWIYHPPTSDVKAWRPQGIATTMMTASPDADHGSGDPLRSPCSLPIDPITPIEETPAVQSLPLFDDAETLDGDEQPADDAPILDDNRDESKDHAVLLYLMGWGADFDRPFTAHTRRGDLPHKLMERLLTSGPARWGILCNGRRIRLLKRDVVVGRLHYYEVDLEALFENQNEQDAERKEQGFDTFWTLFRAQAFHPGPDGRCLLDILEQESRKHAEGVSSTLKQSVFQALDILMSELVTRARALSTQPLPENVPPHVLEREQWTRTQAVQALRDLPTLYTQSLVYLYRLLFVLYAESRDLLPVENAVYRDSYSLLPLRDEIDEPNADARYLPGGFRLWESLQALFRLIHRGCNTTQLVVPAYNGALFDPASVALLQTIRVSDRALSQVLLQLSVTRTKERGRERVEYRDLGVEQLGAVYEGLLEFEPRVASEPMVEVTYKGARVIIPQREQRTYKVERPIETGQFYLGRGAGRKTSGSYYTPQPLVDFLVERTLKPLVQGRSPDELLALKVVDPAMGSGAFLVGACLYLADAYARAIRTSQGNQANIHASMDAGMTGGGGIYDDGCMAGASREDLDILADEPPDGDGELSEEDTRPYRRLVAERCLYGVDLNPMAVELAKVSLWLTTLAGDKPLTFLDANLARGNSLIGAPLHLAGHGQEDRYTIYTIHPEAAKRLARARGDTVATRGSKNTKRSLWDDAEEAQEHTILDELNDVRDTVPALVDHRRLIAEQPSDTVEQVHEKAALFTRQVVGDGKRQMLEQICNLWIAAWFWPQPPQGVKPGEPGWAPPLDGPVYTELVNHIRSRYHEGPGQLALLNLSPYLLEVEQIIKDVRPFHWELEFPEVYFEPDGSPRANPGFDAVLGNPPWDIIKPNSREFFSAYDPAFRELERVQAEHRQEELLKDREIQSEWDAHVFDLNGQVSYMRLCDLYPYQSDIIDNKQTGGDANTYKLFLERAYNLMRQHGQVGIIVPSGLYTDQGATGLRKLFLKRAQISALYCFENRRGIFPIDSRFKFVLFGVSKAYEAGAFDAAFMLHDMQVLSAPEPYSINIPPNLISRFSPDTYSIMEFRSQRDLDIVTQMYGSSPLLGMKLAESWSVDFTSEFHMTGNRSLFNQEDRGCSLYEGKMIHQYTHRFSKPRYWVDAEKGREELVRREIQRVEEALDNLAIALSRSRKTATRKDRIKSLFSNIRRGPLDDKDVYIAPDTSRIAFRTIARNTDERTLIVAILPPNVFAGHSIAYLTPWKIDVQQALNHLKDIKSCYRPSLPVPLMMYLCGVLNSFVLDYVIRFKVSANISTFYVYQLPVPRLTADDPHCRAIARRVAQLVCIGPEFDGLRAELLGSVGAHVATIVDERRRLQNEIDALVAHLYGLRVEDLEHILFAPYTFPLVKREVKEGVMAAFGRVGEMVMGG